MSSLCGHVQRCSGTTGGDRQEEGQAAVQVQEHQAGAGAS